MKIFDPRSETNLRTLLPAAERRMREFLAAVLEAMPENVTAKIISGHRTFEEQAELYARGRTKPGPKVTNAKPGYSNHNFGVAADLAIFKRGDYLESSPYYRVAGEIGKSLGLAWGGDWKRFRDEPHFEVPTGYSLTEMRRRVAKGLPLLTDSDEWRVYLGAALLGNGTEDGEGVLWWPARSLLSRVYGPQVVMRLLGYNAARWRLLWAGEDIAGVRTRRTAEGSVLAPLPDLAAWLALDLVRDEGERTLTLRRPD